MLPVRDGDAVSAGDIGHGDGRADAVHAVDPVSPVLTFRPCCPGLAGVSLVALRALYALGPLWAGGALRSGVAGIALLAFVALRPLRPGLSGIALVALVTLRPLRPGSAGVSLRPGLPRLAGIALRPLRPHEAFQPLLFRAPVAVLHRCAVGGEERPEHAALRRGDHRGVPGAFEQPAASARLRVAGDEGAEPSQRVLIHRGGVGVPGALAGGEVQLRF